jgi:hypothetical protein
MILSLKQFATGFLTLRSPVKATDAAAAVGFTRRPISLLAVISSAAPFVPKVGTVPLLDCSNNTEQPGGGPPLVVFSWVDEANYGSPPSNPRRQATSWNLTVWEAPSLDPPQGAPVINATVLPKNESAGVLQYDYVSIQLHGEYMYQITAFNDYGSATTGKRGPVAITVPGTSPTIRVKKVGGPNAEFTITGSGFTPGGNVSLLAWASGNGGWGVGWTITASPHGGISTFNYCKQICSQAGGGSLQFTATDEATNTTSTVNMNCP